MGSFTETAYRQRFGIRVQSDEIALEAVHRMLVVHLGHTGVDHQIPRGWWGEGVVGEQSTSALIPERVKRIVSPDVVRARVRPDYVLESAGIDLVIVLRIAPTADAGGRVFKEGGVVHIGGVCMTN